MFRRVFFLIAIAVLMVPSLFAQQGSSAALNGTVKDSSGAVVPGAQVIATETSTNVQTKAVSAGTGTYSMPSLPPGTYKITATHAGFNPATLQGVALHTAQLLTVDMTLTVGGGTETVEVSSDAQLLETSTAQLSHYISEKELTTWPIVTDHDGERQLQAFIFDSLPGTSGNTFVGSINGGQYFSNEIYLDGVSMGTFDTAEGAPSLDAISDFNLQSGYMGAQYNGGGTAVSNYSVKSGTNSLHGSLYEFFQNEDLNANSYTNKQNGRARPKSRLNNYGGTVGGPIFIPKIYDGRDKSFFFVSDEKTSITNYVVAGTTTMPTQATLGGDFSGFLNPLLTLNPKSGTVAGTDALGRPVVFGQIYDPATQRVVHAGQVDPKTGLVAVNTGLVREPFANNQIPTGRFDSVAAAYLKLKFPTNYTNGLLVNNIPRFAAGQPTFSQNVLAIKLDQVLTSNQKVSFFFTTIGRNRSNSGNGAWAVPGASPLDTWHFQNNPGKIIRANHYWDITPTVVNHFGIGYQRFTNIFTTPFSGQNWASTLGIQNSAPKAFPTITFSAQPGLGQNDQLGDSSNGSGDIAQNVIGIDQVFISHGAHQLQFGTEWRFYRENDIHISSQASFNVSNALTDDGQSTSKFAGNAFASFLLGQVNSSGRTIYNGNTEFNRREVGTYIQDDWKVTPRLSLNLGLRWEVMGGITEAHGQMTQFNPLLPNSAAGNLPGALQFASQLKKKGFERTDWGLILPRFGITYAVNPKLVWRAGFGINTQSPEGGPEFQFNGPPSIAGYSGRIAVNHTTNPQPYSDMAVATLSAAYPSLGYTLPNYDPTQANGQGATYIRPDGSKVTYVENYNMGIQYDLGHKTIAEINYVGNTGKRLYAYGTDQLNQLPISYLARYGDALLDNISQHPEITKPYAGFTGLVQQALAPFPQYQGGNVGQYDYNIGWSRYDSLQAQITRKVGSGLNVMAAYTWSKTMTNTNSNCNSGECSPVQDVHNLRLEKAVALGIHFPQQFKLTMFYDLPFGANRQFALHGPLDWVAGGWTISGNGTYQSGNTLQITDGLVSNGIFASTRPNYTGERVELNQGGTIYTNGKDFAKDPQYLNPAAFTHVPYTSNNTVALTTGNVPSALGNVLGPGMASEQASLQKKFSFGENKFFQLRADAINAFNRSGRGDPVTDINDPNFGRITGTKYSPRVVQLSGRISF